MKIQLIGTGAIRSKKNSASVLINNHILFDVPNGNLKAMIRQNIDIFKIDTIIISHAHADHCFDIPFVLWNKERYGENKHNKSTKIITDRNTKKSIELLIEASNLDSAQNAQKEIIDFAEIEGIEIEKGLEITNERMKHSGIEYANGYIIKDNNIKIGLTGDTCICEGVIKLAKNVDILIADMTKEVGNESHMGINNIKELLNENPKLKVIPIHMEDSTREKAQSMNIENLMIVDDGSILEF